eukprot:gene35825-48169_t
MIEEVSGLFRKRDVVILILVAVTLYISMLDNPTLRYSIEPAWFIDQRIEKSPTNKGSSIDNNEGLRSSELDYHLLSPIITDLDGDGANEIICVTRDRFLKIFNAEAPKLNPRDIYHPEVV